MSRKEYLRLKGYWIAKKQSSQHRPLVLVTRRSAKQKSSGKGERFIKGFYVKHEVGLEVQPHQQETWKGNADNPITAKTLPHKGGLAPDWRTKHFKHNYH